jgi:hypothetical protein
VIDQALEPQGVHRQAAERGQDLHAVAFAIAMRVLPELGVAGPVPGILNRPLVSHVLQQSCGRCPETRDLVTGYGFRLTACTSTALPSRVHLQRTAMIVALPGHCSIIPSGAGMAPKSQVMSRPRLISRLLVRQCTRWL